MSHSVVVECFQEEILEVLYQLYVAKGQDFVGKWRDYVVWAPAVLRNTTGLLVKPLQLASQKLPFIAKFPPFT